MDILLLSLLLALFAAPSLSFAQSSDLTLADACLRYVRVRQQLPVDQEPTGPLAQADQAFSDFVESKPENRAARIAEFKKAVRSLDEPAATDDPAAVILSVLSDRSDTRQVLRQPDADCYGALFQMIMEGRQPLRPRLAFVERLMSMDLPVTFLDLGLEGVEDAVLRQIAAVAAGRTVTQSYPTTEEDYYRVLVQLDNLGGKFGRQQDAAYLARKFEARPEVQAQLEQLKSLPGMTLAFFGDSQTDNRHWSSPGHYPNILQELFAEANPGITVVNAGIGGDDSGEGLKRIEHDVLAHRPDVCFVFFGGNDSAFYGRDHSTITPDQFEANTKAIIERLQSVECRPVLVTYPGIPLFGDESGSVMAEMMNRLASLREAYDTGWVDIRGLFAEHDPRRVFAVDMVHFSPEGHFLIADAVLEWLVSNDPE